MHKRCTLAATVIAIALLFAGAPRAQAQGQIPSPIIGDFLVQNGDFNALGVQNFGAVLNGGAAHNNAGTDPSVFTNLTGALFTNFADVNTTGSGANFINQSGARIVNSTANGHFFNQGAGTVTNDGGSILNENGALLDNLFDGATLLNQNGAT